MRYFIYFNFNNEDFYFENEILVLNAKSEITKFVQNTINKCLINDENNFLNNVPLKFSTIWTTKTVTEILKDLKDFNEAHGNILKEEEKKIIDLKVFTNIVFLHNKIFYTKSDFLKEIKINLFNIKSENNSYINKKIECCKNNLLISEF